MFLLNETDFFQNMWKYFIHHLDSSEEKSDIICEHYEKEISCSKDHLIQITYANYGRSSEIPCQGKRKYITTNCKSKKSLALAKKLCDGNNQCKIKALNSVWGNSCPGVIKYMDIRYQCLRKTDNELEHVKGGTGEMANPFKAVFIRDHSFTKCEICSKLTIRTPKQRH